MTDLVGTGERGADLLGIIGLFVGPVVLAVTYALLVAWVAQGVPVASLIVRSTEQIATRTGDAVGGLLNATFGNAPELIIAIVALRAGLFDLVR